MKSISKNRHFEFRFKIWLIKTWEGSSSISWFEVSCSQISTGTVVGTYKIVVLTIVEKLTFFLHLC